MRTTFPSCVFSSRFERSTRSSAWSQGTSFRCSVTFPFTSSVAMMLSPLTSASTRSTFWMSASLKSSEMRWPVKLDSRRTACAGSVCGSAARCAGGGGAGSRVTGSGGAGSRVGAGSGSAAASVRARSAAGGSAAAGWAVAGGVLALGAASLAATRAGRSAAGGAAAGGGGAASPSNSGSAPGASSNSAKSMRCAGGFSAVPVSVRSATSRLPSRRTAWLRAGRFKSATMRSAPPFVATRTPAITSSVSGKRVRTAGLVGRGPCRSITSRGGAESAKSRTSSGGRVSSMMRRRSAPMGSTLTSRTMSRTVSGASGAPGVSGGAAAGGVAAGGAAATGALAGFLAARAGAAAARLVSPRSMITFAPSWRTTCAPGARERSTIARSFPPKEPTRTRETSSSASGKALTCRGSAGRGPARSSTSRGGELISRSPTASGVRVSASVSRRPAPTCATSALATSIQVASVPEAVSAPGVGAGASAGACAVLIGEHARPITTRTTAPPDLLITSPSRSSAAPSSPGSRGAHRSSRRRLP